MLNSASDIFIIAAVYIIVAHLHHLPFYMEDIIRKEPHIRSLKCIDVHVCSIAGKEGVINVTEL